MKKYLITIAIILLLPFCTLGQKMGFENNNVFIYGKVEIVDVVIATGGSVT